MKSLAKWMRQFIRFRLGMVGRKPFESIQSYNPTEVNCKNGENFKRHVALDVACRFGID